MHKKQWLFVGLGAVILGLGAFLIFRPSDDRPAYRLEKVSRGDIDLRISATGTLSADTTVQVGSQVSGRIAKLYADYNSTVHQGQMLAQIDPTFLQAAVDQQKAALEKARAEMNDAKRTLDRTSALYKRSLAAQADMDAAMTTYESDKASVQQSRAALEQAQVNLRYAAIRAPISGVVISRNVDVGQTVAASLQAPTLFTIANDLRKMQVQASVDEADVGNVKVGQEVTFRVDAYPNRIFKGAVTQIRLAPVVTQNVVMYTVIIAVSNQDLSLMPGMTATVSVLVAQRGDVLRVPVQAVRFTPPASVADENRPRQQPGGTGGNAVGSRAQGSRSGAKHQQRADADRARVWVLQGEKPVPVMITEGLQNNQYVEVARGNLEEGENVVVGVDATTNHQARFGQTPFGPQRFGGGPRR